MGFASAPEAFAKDAGIKPNFDHLTTRHRTVKAGELDILYREAGPRDAPVILLLHGKSRQPG